MQAPHIRTARDTIQDSSGLVQINFLQLVWDLLQDVINMNNHEIDVMKQELAVIENSGLHIDNSHESSYYRSRNKVTRTRVSITDDLDRVHLLARRKYLENRIEAAELTSAKMSRIITAKGLVRLDQKLLQELKKYINSGLDIMQFIFTKEQVEWINSPYTPNPFHLDSLKQKTAGNIPMRSNAEAKLGSYIESTGLPYRADDIVLIQSNIHNLSNAKPDATPHRDSYFADFKIPNLLGGITVHEHLGAFYIDNYGDNSLKRLNDYHNFTVIEIPGRPVTDREFTWSFASDLANEQTLRALLGRMLLPGFL